MIKITIYHDTNIILLDETTNYFDMTHQIEILDLLFELNETENRTIVMVLHDLNLACRYAHNIVAIRDRKVYKQGKQEEVVNCKYITDVFDIQCQVLKVTIFGIMLSLPQ